jgi:hypothetical protein
MFLGSLLLNPEWRSAEFFLTWRVVDMTCSAVQTGTLRYSIFRLAESMPRTYATESFSLDTASRMTWATPAARDYRHPNSPESQERRKQGREKAGEQLPNQVAQEVWRTPQAAMTSAKANVTKLKGREATDPQVGLPDQVAHLTTGTPPNTSSATTGKPAACPPLNPGFVLWLMGFPAGWLKSLEQETR